MMNMEPAVRIIVMKAMFSPPIDWAAAVAPAAPICALRLSRYAGDWSNRIATVSQRVYWLSFILPLSPSRCIFWNEGNTIPNS